MKDKIEKLKALFSNIKSGYIRVSDIYRYLMLDKNKAALKLLKDQIVMLLKEIKPVKGNGYIRFGSGDPFNTGKVMEIAAVLYPYYESFTEVIPEFDDAALEVKQKAKGRIRLFVPLLIAFRLLRCKELREMYKRLTEEADGLKKDFAGEE